MVLTIILIIAVAIAHILQNLPDSLELHIFLSRTYAINKSQRLKISNQEISSYFYRMKLLTRIAGAVYATLLFYIFFLARRRPHATLFQHHAGVNIHPLKSKIYAFTHYSSMSPYYQWNFISDFFGNIALFIPLPFFLAVIFNIKNGFKIMLTGFVISFCVECTQFILSIGVADVDDLILNTLGTAIGLLCYKLFAKLLLNNTY